MSFDSYREIGPAMDRVRSDAALLEDRLINELTIDGATPTGMVAAEGAVFEAKFMLPWAFSEEAAAHHDPRAFIGRVGVVRLAGVRHRRHRGPAPPRLAPRCSPKRGCVPATSPAPPRRANFTTSRGRSRAPISNCGGSIKFATSISKRPCTTHGGRHERPPDYIHKNSLKSHI